MYSFANSGAQENNDAFSPCSREMMNDIITAVGQDGGCGYTCIYIHVHVHTCHVQYQSESPMVYILHVETIVLAIGHITAFSRYKL